MRWRSPIVRFAGVFALVYGMLIVPWPGWSSAYGAYFRAVGRAFFTREDGKRIVRFEEARTAGLGPLDTQIVLGNRELADANGNGPATILGLDTRGVGWIPTALLVALVVATPVSWRRRGRAFVVGLLAIHGMIVFALGVYIWNESHAASALAFGPLSPFWRAIAGTLEETLVVQMGASVVFPVTIWAVCMFRRRDLMGIPKLFDPQPKAVVGSLR